MPGRCSYLLKVIKKKKMPGRCSYLLKVMKEKRCQEDVYIYLK